MTHIEIQSGGISLFDKIEPLWMKLNEIHTYASVHFAQTFEKFTFEDRKVSLMANAENGEILVEIAGDSQAQSNIGYCVTIVSSAKKGEIESIYVDPKYRSMGLGDKLMKRALKWLDKRNVSEKTTAVVFGHEKVYTFYAKYGFYPRITVLKQRDEED